MCPQKLIRSNTYSRSSYENNRTAFVLMPLAKDINSIYRLIKDTIKNVDENLACYRADEIHNPGPIFDKITNAIINSQLIIADVTGRNPNVYLELGYALAYEKPCIILSQSNEDIPFDIRNVRIIFYDNTIEGAESLKNSLINGIRSIFNKNS